MKPSLGVIPQMLYCNGARFEVRAGMTWFRSNIRPGSRLALFALAIQFLLSFGHFHGGTAQAAPAWVDAKHSGLHRAGFAVTHWRADASRYVALKTSSDHRPDGQPGDDCAICAAMALASAMAVATPPCLLVPQAAAFLYLTGDAAFVDPHAAGVAFQPRAPPVA